MINSRIGLKGFIFVSSGQEYPFEVFINGIVYGTINKSAIKGIMI
jgi:hypothetical protein